MGKNIRWAYRFKLPRDIVKEVEKHQPRNYLRPNLKNSSEEMQTTLHWKRFWGAFIYSDEIWIGLDEQLFRIDKKSGLLMNTFVVPDRFLTYFPQFFILPLRPLGKQTIVFGIFGIRNAQKMVLPFLLDFSKIEPKYLALDGLDMDDSILDIDWQNRLFHPEANSRFNPMTDIGEHCVHRIKDFVILNLSNKVSENQDSDFTLVATDTDFEHIPEKPLKEIFNRKECLKMDFHETTHARVSYWCG